MTLNRTLAKHKWTITSGNGVSDRYNDQGAQLLIFLASDLP